MIIAVAFIVGLFRSLYSSASDNILRMWETKAIQMARSAEYYLARPADAIEFTAVQVENMIDAGQSNGEIKDMLIREMETYAPLVDSNYTGVYGYVRREYLDASGWIPPEGYEPTQRPWYTAAKQAGGRVAFVQPYNNLQTHVLMMSVSKLLKDGDSVVSMDIFLDGMQRIATDMLTDKCVKAAFIMDKDGFVVAHSDPDETGRNYSEDGNEYHKAIKDLALQDKEDSIAIHRSSYQELVYSESINDDWLAVLVLDEAEMMSSIQPLKLYLLLVIVLTVLVWFGISKRINRKYEEAKRLSHEISAVADIYDAMTLVDLKTGMMTHIRSNDFIDSLLGDDLSDYNGRISSIAERMASDQSRDLFVQFMDPTTYDERIKNVNSISHDFLDSRGMWSRIQLIVIDRDSSGKLWHIIWALESIDEEHKQKEQLQKLAETDALSRVLNRRSGEANIKRMLSEGVKGTFILADIDDFKGVNDTYGHKAGDLVIVALADKLRNIFRDEDIVYRLGGDEFAIFVSGVENPDTVERITDRIKEDVGQINLPELKGYQISVSTGSAYCKDGENYDFDALYQRADQEMYKNKRNKKSLH